MFDEAYEKEDEEDTDIGEHKSVIMSLLGKPHKSVIMSLLGTIKPHNYVIMYLRGTTSPLFIALSIV